MLVLYWSSGGGSKENIEDNGILWGDLINASTSLLADGLVIAGLILVTAGTEGVAASATIPMGIHFSIQAGAHINDFINALNGTPNNKMNGYQTLGNDLSTIIGGKDDGVLNKVGQVGDDASLVYSLTTGNYSPKNVKNAYGIANNISSGLNKAVDIVKSWFEI